MNINKENILEITRYDNKDCLSVPEGTEIIEEGIFTDDLFEVDEVEILLPGTLVEIRDHAFAGLTKIKKIIIPSSVQKMGKGVFKGCSNLELVVDNSISLDCIPSETFMDCVHLQTVQVTADKKTWIDGNLYENKIYETIGNSAFKNCISLETVNLNSRNIEESAFSNCCQLKKIELTYTEKIEKKAFEHCDKLNELFLDEFELDLERIYSSKAFDHPESITIFDRNEDYTSIQRFAFRNGFNFMIRSSLHSEDVIQCLQQGLDMDEMEKKKSYYLYPKHITITNSHCFRRLIENNVLILPDETTIIDEASFAGWDIEKVVMPRSLLNIGVDAFSCCPQLKYVDFSRSNDLKFIGEDAFKDCPELQTVALPQNVKRIGDRCFCGCTKLDRVNLNINLEYIGEKVFSQCPALKTISAYTDIVVIGKDMFSHSPLPEFRINLYDEREYEILQDLKIYQYVNEYKIPFSIEVQNSQDL